MPPRAEWRFFLYWTGNERASEAVAGSAWLPRSTRALFLSLWIRNSQFEHSDVTKTSAIIRHNTNEKLPLRSRWDVSQNGCMGSILARVTPYGEVLPDTVAGDSISGGSRGEETNIVKRQRVSIL
jgi:hypothetical protein